MALLMMSGGLLIGWLMIVSMGPISDFRYASVPPGTTFTAILCVLKFHETATVKLSGISRSTNLTPTPKYCPTVLTRGEKSSSDSPHVSVTLGVYSLKNRERYSVLPSTQKSAS